MPSEQMRPDLTKLPWPDGCPGFERGSQGGPRLATAGAEILWERRACERAIVWFAARMRMRISDEEGYLHAFVQCDAAKALLAWLDAARQLEARA